MNPAWSAVYDVTLINLQESGDGCWMSDREESLSPLEFTVGTLFKFKESF